MKYCIIALVLLFSMSFAAATWMAGNFERPVLPGGADLSFWQCTVNVYGSDNTHLKEAFFDSCYNWGDYYYVMFCSASMHFIYLPFRVEVDLYDANNELVWQLTQYLDRSHFVMIPLYGFRADVGGLLFGGSIDGSDTPSALDDTSWGAIKSSF